MHSRTAIRNPFTAPDALTLSDVLDRLGAPGDLTERQRADLRSAVRTVGRALDRPLTELPAHPEFLGRRLRQINPAAVGMRKSRWANVRSLFRKALEMAGVATMPGRYQCPLTPAWAGLASGLPSKAYDAALSRFAHYSSANDIAPDDVSQQTFDRFLTAVEQESFLRKPREVHRDACRFWNMAADHVEGWPQIHIRVPCYKPRVVLPWESFPASLKDDFDAMERDATDPLLLSPHGRRPIKPESARNRIAHLHRLASVVVRRGREPLSLGNLADLVEVGIVKEGLRFFLEANDGQTSLYIHGLMKVVCVVARNWVKVDDDHMAELDALRRRVAVSRPGMTEKNQETLRHFHDEATIRAMLSLPARVFRELGDKKDLKVSQCVTTQIALAIQLLLVAPVRIGNLASVSLDRHLVRVGQGPDGRHHLFFPAHEVKNDIDLEFPVPPAVQAMIETYRERYRPVLLRCPSDYLFPGQGKEHKGSSLISAQIANLTEQQLGVRVTAHQFRHLAGFLYLRQNPGGHEVVRRLLGHRSISTTVQFYAGMETSAAIAEYERVVLQVDQNVAA